MERVIPATAGNTGPLIRGDLAVLVVECQALGMIAVIRSLGRAGYKVHCASSDPDALGFHSRYCSVSVCHAPYSSAEFMPWLDNYVRTNHIAAIIPSEGFLHAIYAGYEKYRSLIPDAVSVISWQTCLSKVATQLKLLEVDPECPHLPPGGVIVNDASVPDATELGRHTAPFFLKADTSQAIGDALAAVILCEDGDALLRQIANTRPHYRAMLWQSFAPGMKVGVSLWRHGGKFMAENMVLGLHMHPHTGGMMSLRKTFWHEAILADAKLKLEQLDWHGVAMMEYKWNPKTNEFWFIEINARYWGYLHLDLLAGKDFPRLQLDAHFGHVASDMGPARNALYCRNTIPGEMMYLASMLKDPKVRRISKISQTINFALLLFHPTMKADLLFPADRNLYWRAWLRFFCGLVATRRNPSAKAR